MKIPRDIHAKELILSLQKLDYTVTRKTGSHLRLTTEKNGVHHITIPMHNPLKIGTLNSILNDVAQHFKIDKTELLKILNLK